MATDPLEQLRRFLPDSVREERRTLVSGLVRSGWSRYRIAKALGVSAQTVHNWEKGNR